MPGGAGAAAAAGPQSEETRRLQALFCRRRSLPPSCRGDAALASTKGLQRGSTASPAPGEVRVARAQVAVPRLPLPVPGHVQPSRGPCSVQQSRGGGALRCRTPPPHGRILLMLLSLCPLQPQRCPRAVCRQQLGMERGVSAAHGAARPSRWRAMAGSPWAACGQLMRAPTGMPPRGVPAAEPQRPPQPVWALRRPPPWPHALRPHSLRPAPAR